MRWRNGTDAALSFALSVVLAACLYAGTATALQDDNGTKVQVSLCPQGGEAFLTLDGPRDETTVRTPQVVVTGEVKNLSDARFYINDVLQKTLILGETATAFEQPITVADGLQTIRVVGRDACGQEVVTRRLSITVSLPKSVSSSENKVTDTDNQVLVNKGTKTPNAIVYHEAAPASPPEAINEEKEQQPSAGSGGDESSAGVPSTDKITDWFDLQGTLMNPANAFRGGVAIVAIYVAVHAQAVINQVQRIQRLVNHQPSPKPKAGRRPKVSPLPLWKTLLPRLVGIAILIGLFVV